MTIDRQEKKEFFSWYLNKYHELRKIEEKAVYSEDDYKSSGPLNVYVEPTNHCNLDCEFCARETMTRKLELLGFEAFKNIVEGIPKFSWITFTGEGEPLLNNRVYDMIHLASEKGYRTRIITNGTVLNSENRRKLIESGIKEVQFSFDVIDKPLYEKIRKGANFETTLLNILSFIKEIDELEKDIFISISSVQTEEVQALKEKNRAFWTAVKVDNYFESPLFSLQQQSKSYQAIEIDQKANFRSCVVPWVAAKINVDGSVNICSHDFSSKYSIGNVYKESFKEIQNSKKAINLRKAILNKDFDFLNKCDYNCHLCNVWCSGYDFHDYLNQNFPFIANLNYEKIFRQRTKRLLEEKKQLLQFIEKLKQESSPL